MRRGLRGLGDSIDVTTLQTLAANAGFTGSDVNVAAAIAMAESGGNSNDYNPETRAKGGTPQGQGSFGLWQIYLHAHPEFASWNLYDPQTNANAAFSVYQAAGFSFSPWTTFRSGQYMAYLQQFQQQTPLTIDASTGEIIDSSADSSANTMTTAASPQFPQSIILLTAAALGLYFLGDYLLGD